MVMVKLSSENDQTYSTFKTALREYLAVAQKKAQQLEAPSNPQQIDNSGVSQGLYFPHLGRGWHLGSS